MSPWSARYLRSRTFRRCKQTPAFSTFAEFLTFAGDKGLVAAAVVYEAQRSGTSAAEIREAFADLCVMREAVATGLENKLELLGGFCAGDDAAKMMTAWRTGKTISGGILPLYCPGTQRDGSERQHGTRGGDSHGGLGGSAAGRDFLSRGKPEENRR